MEEVVWIINNASHSAVKRDFEVMDKDGCFAALEYTISPSVATQDTDGVILRPALEAVGNMLRAAGINWYTAKFTNDIDWQCAPRGSIRAVSVCSASLS